MAPLDCFAVSRRGADSPTNEDAFALDAKHGIVVVADGMGGHAGGAEASSTAAKLFVKRVRKLPPRARSDGEKLRAIIDGLNDDIRSLGDRKEKLRGLGTTLTAVVLTSAGAKLAHVGDSRAYVFRNGSLQQVSADHTLVAEMVERKHLTPDQARTHAMRNVLARAIGSAEDIDPQIADLAFGLDEWLILSTDGLSKSLDETQLSAAIAANAGGSARQMCEAIVGAVKSGADDITVAAVRRRA